MGINAEYMGDCEHGKLAVTTSKKYSNIF